MIPSLPKLLALAGVIWLVFKAFRMLENHRAAARNDDGQNNKDQNETPSANDARQSASLDLEECRQCGAWVAGQSCGQENCPYTG